MALIILYKSKWKIWIEPKVASSGDALILAEQKQNVMNQDLLDLGEENAKSKHRKNCQLNNFLMLYLNSLSELIWQRCNRKGLS